MTRTRSPEIAKRNEEIFALWQRGASLASLGARYKISRQVVGRVVASFHPEDDEDTDRSVYRGYLWRLFDEVRDVFDSPGWKMSPTGRPAVGPDDEPAEDVMAKIEAAKLQLAVLESLRKLDARDRVQPKVMTVQFDLAHQQMQRDLEEKRRELEASRGALQPPVVRGEVLPTGGGGEEQQRGEEGPGLAGPRHGLRPVICSYRDTRRFAGRDSSSSLGSAAPASSDATLASSASGTSSR